VTSKTVLRAFVASILIVSLSAVWPFAAQAGKMGGGSGKAKDSANSQQKAAGHSVATGTKKRPNSFEIQHKTTIGSQTGGAGSGGGKELSGSK
jgi:hypothetical protein